MGSVPRPGWGYEVESCGAAINEHVALPVECFERREPWIARVYDLEASPQPLPLLSAQPGNRDAKVVLILLQVMLRLVEQLDLRRDDRQPGRGTSPHLGRRPLDAGISPAQPDPILDVVQEELQLVAAGLPGLLQRRATRRKREDLVDRELEPIVLFPGIESTGPLGFEQLPVGEVRLQRTLIPTEDPDLDVLVRPRHLVEEEVDRPAAGDEPQTVERAQ